MEAEELKFYLNHWGIHLADETFNKIFETLDWDKDGKVSYPKDGRARDSPRRGSLLSSR